MDVQAIAMSAAAKLLPTSRTGSYRPAGVVADAFDVYVSLATPQDDSTDFGGQAGILSEGCEALVQAAEFVTADVEPEDGGILLIDGELYEVRSRGESVSKSTCGNVYILQLMRVS